MSFAFNIFVPIPVRETLYWKAIQKITRWTFLYWEQSIKKRIRKFREGCSPLTPLNPSMIISIVIWKLPNL